MGELGQNEKVCSLQNTTA